MGRPRHGNAPVDGTTNGEGNPRCRSSGLVGRNALRLPVANWAIQRDCASFFGGGIKLGFCTVSCAWLLFGGQSAVSFLSAVELPVSRLFQNTETQCRQGLRTGCVDGLSYGGGCATVQDGY